METNPQIEKMLMEYEEKGVLNSRIENNPYLKVAYKGAGGLITEKWNIRIYTSGKAVCTDRYVLNQMLKGTLNPPDTSKTLIEIDDAGGGFPLLGVMVGAASGGVVKTAVVDVSFFQGMSYKSGAYLREYAHKGWKLATKTFGATPETHRIVICTGHVNSKLTQTFRERGYDVEIGDIKGLLQDQLEGRFKEYVKNELKNDLAYDPKEVNKNQLGKLYYRALNWGQKNTPHLLKTGWKSIGG